MAARTPIAIDVAAVHRSPSYWRDAISAALHAGHRVYVVGTDRPGGLPTAAELVASREGIGEHVWIEGTGDDASVAFAEVVQC